ncbi:MAG: MazG nucleotide pyrophosphohydrolase domain-containing protein [Candidatus Heimdallarchaeota archaeon]
MNDWIINHGGYWPPLAMLTAIIEELGELAREINSCEGFKPKKMKEKDSNLGEELGDLLFSLICIANYYKIDLNIECNKVIKKYIERNSTRF